MSENRQLQWYAFRWRLFLANSLDALQRAKHRYRFRFSLAALLFAMAAISLFLGYAQLRRQALLRAVAELEGHGVQVKLRDRWSSLIWPEVAKDATYSYRNIDDHTTEIGSRTYDLQKNGRELVLHERAMHDQLKTLGVERYTIVSDGKVMGETWVMFHAADRQ